MSVYDPRSRYHPVCRGYDTNGELKWEFRPREVWQQKLFPTPYKGDFAEQWMRLLILEKYGLGWDDESVRRAA